jgi:hypothetical protein
MSNGFIRYETKNGVEYASVYKAKRVGGKKTNDIEWLGRVIDKEKGIYKSRDRGVFQYTLDNSQVDYLPQKQEKLILDFGDAYFFNEMLTRAKFIDLIKGVFKNKADMMLALVFYRTLSEGASCYAQTWWEGTYTNMLYPNATPASQRISDALREFGSERLQRAFFAKYLKYVSSKCGDGALIDSTGLPNDIDFPLTAINSHNGIVANETRLILVLDKKSRMPIYFRYAAGNIVDVSTLETTVAELKAHGINIKHAIVDAGYCSETNIKALRMAQISFVMRMPPNRKIYKELVKDHAGSLADARHLVKYRDRFIYIKRVEIDLHGVPCYAYVSEDIDRKHDEVKKYFADKYDDINLSVDEMNEAIHNKGLFVLISSEPVDTFAILPLYYTRQAIEQVFDLSKNNIDLLPLRVHGIETFRGHLLVSFIASAAYVLINESLRGSDICATGAYRLFRNLKCKVFDDDIIVQELNKKMNDIAKKIKLSFPKVIRL